MDLQEGDVYIKRKERLKFITHPKSEEKKPTTGHNSLQNYMYLISGPCGQKAHKSFSLIKILT